MARKQLGKGRGFKAMERAANDLSVRVREITAFRGHSLDQTRMRTFALRRIKKLVISSLLRSLAASGVRNKSGRLRRAVANSRIWIERGKLRIAMANSTPQDVLRYTSSVNYGAIRDSGGLGAKAKLSLKNAILKDQALTKRQLASLAKGVKQKHGINVVTRGSFKGQSEASVRKLLGGKLGGKLSIGGASVIRPKPFYYISVIDKKRIAAAFEQAFQDYIAQETSATAPKTSTRVA